MTIEQKVEEKPINLLQRYSAAERISICRHPQRPKSTDFINHVFDSFEQIHGDRLFKEDHSMICGFAYLGDVKCAVVAQEKGNDTEERLKRNFGMNFPEGYRKALRTMKLAEKFDLPLICLIDTPGAYPGLEAEQRGQALAIANNLKQMSLLKIPTLSLVIGEGCSGGALGIGVTDKILMLEHAYYSVISPEGCASILWKDPSKKEVAASALKLHAEDLIGLSIVDQMIQEPQAGAHTERKTLFEDVKKALTKNIESLKLYTTEELVALRYKKFRSLGVFV